MPLASFHMQQLVSVLDYSKPFPCCSQSARADFHAASCRAMSIYLLLFVAPFIDRDGLYTFRCMPAGRLGPVRICACKNSLESCSFALRPLCEPECLLACLGHASSGGPEGFTIYWCSVSPRGCQLGLFHHEVTAVSSAILCTSLFRRWLADASQAEGGLPIGGSLTGSDAWTATADGCDIQHALLHVPCQVCRSSRPRDAETGGFNAETLA